MSTVGDVAAELCEEMALGDYDRGALLDAVRRHIEGTYEDATARGVSYDKTGVLAARRAELSRAVWADVVGSEWPW